MKCVACSSSRVVEVLEIPGLPVFCNQLCHTREAALQAPLASMKLLFCGDCEHLFNSAFEPERLAYTPEYENSLHFSGRFQHFADALADRLRKRYQLKEKTVVELGCGSGSFLKSLCNDPSTRGFGFDASYPGDAVAKPPANIKIESRFFGPEDADLRPNLLCSRHVLEHIAEPVPWLKQMRRCLDRGVSVYLEVPNSLYTLRDGGIWDLIYEHCGYFSPRSVTNILHRCGFQVNELEESFEGQFLSVFAETSDEQSPSKLEFNSASDHLEAFRTEYRRKLDHWQTRLNELRAEQQKVVIWGAGSKGNSFLNLIARDAGIRYAVDLNPRKQGKFVAGTGQEILAPKTLQDYRPDVVIVMNAAYLEEIEATGSNLGLSPQYWAA